MRSAPAALSLAAAVATACGASPLPEDRYVAAVTEAARAERANRYVEAADAYERAAGLTSNAMISRTALYRAAQAAERAGLADRAESAFLAIADRFPGTPEAGRSLYDTARLHRRAGDDGGAVDFLLRLVRDEPDNAMASVGIRRLTQIFEDRGDGEGLDALLTGEIARATDAEITVVLLYSRAIERADAGRIDDALADLGAAGSRCEYPACSYWDDIPWRAAGVCAGAGRFDCAVAFLDDLLHLREESWLNGSYYSVFYDDAQRLKGRILRDDMGRPAEAAEAFLELDDFADSVLRDDGLFDAATIYIDTLDDSARGCDILRRLLDEHPDSSLRRRAAERLSAPPCS